MKNSWWFRLRSWFSCKPDWIRIARNVANDAEAKFEYTTDLGILQKYENQLIFICNEYMKNNYLHYALASLGAVYEGKAYTEEHFELYKFREFKDGAQTLPTVIPLLDVNGYRIQGELYKLPSEALATLDKLMENEVKFFRKRRKILWITRDANWVDKVKESGLALAKYTTVYQDKLTAWMYVGIPEVWDEQIDGGYLFTRCSVYTPNNPFLEKYFYFNKDEYTEFQSYK